MELIEVVTRIATRVVMTLLLALSIVGCSADPGDPTASERAIHLPTSTSQDIKIPGEGVGEDGPRHGRTGEIIESGDLVLQVLGWNIHEGFGETYVAESGKMLITVDLIIVNRGNEPVVIGTLYGMKLRDGAGQIYEHDVKGVVASHSYSPLGEFEPGERIRGRVGFQVPKEPDGMTFIFDSGEFYAGEILVELNAEPGTLPPPNRLPGEIPPTLTTIGEQATVGGLRATVNDLMPIEGGFLFQPFEGMRFLALEVTMENIDIGPRETVDLFQMYLKDSTGQKYDVDGNAMVALLPEEYDFNLPKGGEFTGKVGFQVPEGMTEFVFVIDVNLFEHGKIFFHLDL